jgi:NAD(P)-dependent dehydrogenase (short-subunit alcohol dehydrogenase family)
METAMNVFVAGASGAISRPLVAELVRRGHAVTGLTRSEAGARALAALGAAVAQVSAFDAPTLEQALLELADEESLEVRREEARAVVDPGIPALGGRPGPDHLDLLGPHRPDDEARLRGAHLDRSHPGRTADSLLCWTTPGTRPHRRTG